MITSGETAVLVTPKSPDQLAKAILDLSQSPSELERLSHVGRAHIVAHYRASLGAETLINGYKHTKV